MNRAHQPFTPSHLAAIRLLLSPVTLQAMSDSAGNPPKKSLSPASFTAAELLRELFAEEQRSERGDLLAEAEPTLGLYPVADGKLALVHGSQLAEFTPISGKAAVALHCDLCHYTRSRSEASIYRVVVAQRLSRYVTLCSNTGPCQERAGKAGLTALAERIFPVESGAEML